MLVDFLNSFNVGIRKKWLITRIKNFSDVKFHPDILRGSPKRGLKEGWGGKIQPFTGKHHYLENGSRYGQSYY